MFGWLTQRIIQWLNHERPPLGIPLSNFERIRYEIKPGDVLLVEGRTRVSEIIKLATQSPWSHAALYIGRLHEVEDPRSRQRIQAYFDSQPDVQLIIESELGQGTVVRPLSVYERAHVRICRPRDLHYRDAQRIANYAVGRLGNHYDLRQIFDLLRFLMPWLLMPRRWRSSLFIKNEGQTSKTVCSTMIAEAFASIDFPILPLVRLEENGEIKMYRRNPKLCVPSDFDYSPYFEIIKYPFIDYLHDQPRYRLMPWHRSDDLQHAMAAVSEPPPADAPPNAPPTKL